MEINNKIKLEKDRNNFLNNIIGKTVNNAIDIGLKAILPDFIENQVIDIKNTLFQNGLKDGINGAINTAIDFGKSSSGVITENFENISQVNKAIGNGNIVNTISKILDKVVNDVYKKGYINKNTKDLITNGKNILLNNITNNIKNELKEQNNYIENLEGYIDKWKDAYEKKDFSKMEKVYSNIEKESQKIIPLEKVLEELKKVKSMHNLIKNNGQNFDINEEKKRLAQNLEL